VLLFLLIACAQCHPAETKLHEQTRMARAMTPALTSAFAAHIPSAPLRESSTGFQLSYTPLEPGLQVTAKRGPQTATGIIEWVLGAGSQGQTPLVRVGDTLFESRVSYFPQLDRYGITIGQPAGTSSNAEAALGRKLSHKDAQSCLQCHSTGDPMVAGVQCERCHAGSEQHALKQTPVANPGKMSPRDQLNLCGSCHRVTPPVDDTQAENVRFQPLRLLKSRCFTSGKLECTTCHPAHMDAKRNNAAFYNEKCITCHATAAMGQHTDQRQTGNCIGCHMPVVQLHPALKFTDHYIRVAFPAPS
jgi:hypothetical protein